VLSQKLCVFKVIFMYIIDFLCSRNKGILVHAKRVIISSIQVYM